jgi:hypothetical protein
MSEKISFIHIPKNAGTSIQSLCNKYKSLFDYYDHSVDVNDTSIKNQLVVLQNPASRFKSAVRYTFIPKFKNEPQIKYLYHNNITTPNKWVDILKNKEHFHHEALINEINNNKNHSVGGRILKLKWTYSPQSYYINKPKYVLLMENLNEELGVLLAHFNISHILPLKNSTKKTIENDYLSDENIKWLEENLYTEDFEIYNKYKHMSLKERLGF